MTEKIIIVIVLAAAVFYISRRIYKNLIKGEHGGCADCPPSEIKNRVK